MFLLRDGTPVLPLSLTDLFSAQLQGDQRLVSGAPKPQEQDMALTAGHTVNILAHTVVEVDPFFRQFLRLGWDHNTVPSAGIGQIFDLLALFCKIFAGGNEFCLIDLQRHHIVLSLEVRRILLFDLPVKIHLHTQIILIFGEKVAVDRGVALCIQIEEDIVDEATQVDIVRRFNDRFECFDIRSVLMPIIVGIGKIQIGNARLDQLFREIHCLICSKAFFDPEDDRDTRLIFFRIGHIGEQVIKAREEFAVLLPE